MMIQKVLMLVCALGLMVASAGAQDDVTINYQGRLKAGGSNFDGLADFYFALIAKDGSEETVLWTNDGSDPTALPPNSPVQLDTVEGVFDVVLGDTSIPDMTQLHSSIFSNQDKLFLRVWVNAGSGIEQLQPDRRIASPDILGQRSRSELNLYVNAATGNDKFPGLTPARPKKTIQAAIDAVPSTIEQPTTINIADGTYPESVSIRRVSVVGEDASFTIVGDPANPGDVILEGGGIRANGMAFEFVRALPLIKGITAQNYTGAGFRCTRSEVRFEEVVSQTNAWGVESRTGSTVYLTRVILQNNQRGADASGFAYFNFDDCEIKNNTINGVWARTMSHVYIHSGTLIQNSGHLTNANAHALYVTEQSYAYIEDATFASNPGRAIQSNRNSYVLLAASNTQTFTNNNRVGEATKAATIEYRPSSLVLTGNTNGLSSDSTGNLITY